MPPSPAVCVGYRRHLFCPLPSNAVRSRPILSAPVQTTSCRPACRATRAATLGIAVEQLVDAGRSGTRAMCCTTRASERGGHAACTLCTSAGLVPPSARGIGAVIACTPAHCGQWLCCPVACSRLLAAAVTVLPGRSLPMPVGTARHAPDGEFDTGRGSRCGRQAAHAPAPSSPLHADGWYPLRGACTRACACYRRR